MGARRRLLTIGAVAVAAAMLAVPGVATAAAAHGDVTATPAGTTTSDLARLAGSKATVRLIVRTGSKRAAIQLAVRAAGGKVVAYQNGLGMLVAEGPGSRLIPALRRIPGVVMTPDREVKTQSLGFDPATQNGSLTRVTSVTGATGMWTQGYTGKGIDVAVLDTGVAPVPGLNQPDKVVVGPDLSFESQSDDTRYLDTYGHGTHMSGIIAGREVPAGSGASYAQDTQNFYGMAPDSRIVSVKLGDHNGVVDVSQVIAGIDWVTQFGHTNGMNVRVINLSLGLDSPQNPLIDPLVYATQVAWNKGYVVVASAGNNGDDYAGLNSPASNPRIIAVGAEDSKGTVPTTDDTVPSFSAIQGGNYGTRTPDVLAPGVGIVSLKVPGSTIATTYPAAAVGSNFIRGSGTSQAAAVVSGAAALLLQQRPSLTPDQVKALLVNSANKLTGATTGAQGAGLIDLADASTQPVPGTVQNVAAANGSGSLESARGGKNVMLNGVGLSGEQTVWGGQWNSYFVTAATTNAASWTGDGGTWLGAQVLGTGFASDSTTWAGKTWQGKTWQGKTWQGKTWQGGDWTSLSWTGKTWQGNGWSSNTWSSVIGNSGWASRTWATGSWG